MDACRSIRISPYRLATICPCHHMAKPLSANMHATKQGSEIQTVQVLIAYRTHNLSKASGTVYSPVTVEMSGNVSESQNKYERILRVYICALGPRAPPWYPPPPSRRPRATPAPSSPGRWRMIPASASSQERRTASEQGQGHRWNEKRATSYFVW